MEFEQQHKTKRCTGKKSARLLYICEPEHQLSDKDWEVLEIFSQLLGYYECTIKMLEGDGQIRKRKRGWMGSYGNIWDVIKASNSFLTSLRAIKPCFPDPERFMVNINLGWQKLDKYYQLVSETPIYYGTRKGSSIHACHEWP